MIFDKEDIELIKFKEYAYKTALVSNYCTGVTSKDLDLLESILKKYKIKYNLSNRNCNACKVNFMKTVAVHYFESKKHYKEEQEKQDIQNNKKKKNVKKRDDRNIIPES